MPTRTEAEEHLRIIRSLMEKATIYRAISAPTALVGGILAIIAAGILWRLTPAPDDMAENWPNMRFYFLLPWLSVLALTWAANIYFLWRDARLRRDQFISPGMKAALSALAPLFLVAGYVTFFLARYRPFEGVFILPTIWMIFYGLGLLATAHFSPRSIHYLGGAFVVAGLASLTGGWDLPWSLSLWQICNLHMAVTFGLFHLIYAACTWPRKSLASDSGVEP